MASHRNSPRRCWTRRPHASSVWRSLMMWYAMRVRSQCSMTPCGHFTNATARLRGSAYRECQGSGASSALRVVGLVEPSLLGLRRGNGRKTQRSKLRSTGGMGPRLRVICRAELARLAAWQRGKKRSGASSALRYGAAPLDEMRQARAPTKGRGWRRYPAHRPSARCRGRHSPNCRRHRRAAWQR